MSPGVDEAVLGNGADSRGLPLPSWLLDKNSDSITRCHKPAWFFKLQTRVAQQKVMRKIYQLHKTAPELCWEEKWAWVELEYREGCPEVFADDGRLDTRIERLTDPKIFAGCSTEEEKKAALVGNGCLLAESTASRLLSSGKEAGTGSARPEYDEARIWQMLVESCEKASAEKTKARRRRAIA